jgi:hypothetical protein
MYFKWKGYLTAFECFLSICTYTCEKDRSLITFVKIVNSLLEMNKWISHVELDYFGTRYIVQKYSSHDFLKLEILKDLKKNNVHTQKQFLTLNSLSNKFLKSCFKYDCSMFMEIRMLQLLYFMEVLDSTFSHFII